DGSRQLPKPPWLKVKIASGAEFNRVKGTLHESKLHTVCEEALCPNRAECWNSGTATFLILGQVCTRKCMFCAVQSARHGQNLDSKEPQHIARAVKEFGLECAVLTSVDRDDLPDLGAGHFARCIGAVKNAGASVEALIPDFQGSAACLRKIVEAGPDVIAHNIEVVERLQKTARDARASYKQSLGVLRKVKELNPKIFTKSSIMLGLGETREEVLQAMDSLLNAGVDFLTLGQYLQPNRKCIPVSEFIEPKQFNEFKEIALEKGFKKVLSGPLVRSSYRAAELIQGPGKKA
ncbi:MAG: lipoyl synthase, partial [Candidatus Diapherotrites archaeon]|nr:lipoyl synthase [Candidatus Diapherotrites archaeon]